MEYSDFIPSFYKGRIYFDSVLLDGKRLLLDSPRYSPLGKKFSCNFEQLRASLQIATKRPRFVSLLTSPSRRYASRRANTLGIDWRKHNVTLRNVSRSVFPFPFSEDYYAGNEVSISLPKGAECRNI